MQMSSPRPASIVAKPGMNRLSSRMTRMADLMTRSQGRSLPCPLLTGSALDRSDPKIGSGKPLAPKPEGARCDLIENSDQIRLPVRAGFFDD
jgi:hypothetical protein